MTDPFSSELYRVYPVYSLRLPHIPYPHCTTTATQSAAHIHGQREYNHADALPKVRHRRKTSPEQLKVLEHWFNVNPKPDNHLREWLATELGMTKRNIQVWFQNRYLYTSSLQ